MVSLNKTKKELDRDSKFLESGVGDNMIPNSSKRQRLGFTKGIEGFKQTKKGDAFRKENRGKDFKFEIPSLDGKKNRGKDFVFSL